MPTDAARQQTRDELEAAYRALLEECSNDGDSLVGAMAKTPRRTFEHEPTEQRAALAAAVGFRYLNVRRNEMRSDNDLPAGP